MLTVRSVLINMKAFWYVTLFFTQIALPASFSVPPVAVVSPPLYDVMGSGHVMMEVMR